MEVDATRPSAMLRVPDLQRATHSLPRLGADDEGAEATGSKHLSRRVRALVPRVSNEDDEASRTDQTGMIPQAAAVRGVGRPRLTVLMGLSAGMIVPLDSRSRYVVGRARGVEVRLLDPGVSRQHARIRRTHDAFVLEDLSSTNGTLLNGSSISQAKLSPGDRIQLGPNVIVQFALFDATEERLALSLYHSSTRDPLTEAFSHQYFMERLSAEAAYARRHQAPLSLVVLDLDHFKSHQEREGNATADTLLRGVASVTRRLAREEDTFCRLGGEEFALLLRGETLRASATMAERVRRGVETARFPAGPRTIQVTISVGVAELHECRQKDADTLLRIARERLHRAKSRGRNRVCIL